MKIDLLNLRRQYESQKEEIDKAVLEVLESSKYINGPHVQSFEKECAEYLHVKHAISVANGTDALVIALKALGIKSGDEVITTTWTFFATGEAIAIVGATPVFVDCNIDDYTINVDLIESKITDKTKVILPVHIFGQPCNMDRILEIAKKHNLYVLEDAAQAIGANYKGKMIGGIGDITTFSFFPTKNLGGFGDGGLITTNSDELATMIKALKSHGSGDYGRQAYELLNKTKVESTTQDNGSVIFNPAKYFNYLIGYNSRLDEIQAAILRIKLKKLDEWNKERITIAQQYNDKFKDIFNVPVIRNNEESVFHLYILQSDNRDKVIEYLNNNGIATGIYYLVPMHKQKTFEYLTFDNQEFKNAEFLSSRTFAIPASQDLNKEEIDYIIDVLGKWKNED